MKYFFKQYNCCEAKERIPAIINKYAYRRLILALQEKLLKPGDSLKQAGYGVFRNNRETGTGGGVAFMIPTKVRVLEWDKCNTPNIELISIVVASDEPTAIINVYCPRAVLDDENMRCIKDWMENKTLIIGDFNAHNVA
jgi:exonuclease III